MKITLLVKNIESIVTRSIEEENNTSIACVLRASAEGNEVLKVGTLYDNPHTDMMFLTFNIKDAEYWVVECNYVI